MKRARSLRVFLSCSMPALVIVSVLSCGKKEESSLILPQNMSGWVRSDTLKTVNSGSIFDYMDGAGELYIGYRFDRLEVSWYRMPGQDDILAELYFMKSPDDAFGLLSLDWGGESVPLFEKDSIPQGPEIIPDARALYGAGLLRVWSGDLFARIMAYRETAESKAAVLALGGFVAGSRTPADTPGWIRSIPGSLGGSWSLEKDQTRFLRTYLVLNSIYFLSYSNILDLDLATEIAAGRYRLPGERAGNPPVYIFSIRYSSEGKAGNALAHFFEAYFPDFPLKPEERSFSKPVIRRTENKWSGMVLKGRCAVLGFEFPNRKSIDTALQQIIKHSDPTTGGQP